MATGITKTKFDTRRLAENSASRSRDEIDDVAREFIEQADMFFLATCDHRGLPTCSYKGGGPGFVKIVDNHTLAFPNYDGNGKYQSMGNLLKNPSAGLLFIDFINQRRLRIQGIATAHEDDELQAEYPGAQFMVPVQVTEVYSNRPRYVHKFELVERSVFVPREGVETPVATWKLDPARSPHLAANDPARKVLEARERVD